MKPILFSTPMVQAILNGTKTQTRRVVDTAPQSKRGPESVLGFTFIEPTEFLKEDKEKIVTVMNCPYGESGGILWVRETFFAYGHWVKNGTSTSGKQKYKFVDLTRKRGHEYLYDASLILPKKILSGKLAMQDGITGWFKRPSIFMPFIACRIFLKIKSPRVEHLQEISEADAKAEGVKLHERGKHYLDYMKEKHQLTQFIYSCATARESYKTLWQFINDDERMNPDSWYNNPFVWVIEFERTEKPTATILNEYNPDSVSQQALAYMKNAYDAPGRPTQIHSLKK